MSKEYYNDLIEAVGSSFYYYSHKREINLTSKTFEDFEKIKDGWIKEYRAGFDITDLDAPFQVNFFKPAVDMLVHQVLEATEKEIERRVGEIVMERYREEN